MIQHIKISYFIITIFLLCISCKKAKAANINNEEKETTTNIQTLQKDKIFTFYKAFGYCDSEIAYFSDDEANNLYKQKSIEINLNDGETKDVYIVFTPEKLDCINKNLDLKDKFDIKIFKTKDSFPFDNLVLINNEYLIVSRDGYFFVFSVQSINFDEVANDNINCKTFEKEMTSGEECIIYNTKVSEVYKMIIDRKIIDDTHFLEKKLPTKDINKKIDENGLISITYKIRENNSITILFQYDGGETTIELQNVENNVIRKITYSAD